MRGRHDMAGRAGRPTTGPRLVQPVLERRTGRAGTGLLDERPRGESHDDGLGSAARWIESLVMLALLPIAMCGLDAGFNHLRTAMRLDRGMETQPAV